MRLRKLSLLLQIELEGEVATAATLSRMVSNIPLARGGPASVVIFDIHALQVGALGGVGPARREW